MPLNTDPAAISDDDYYADLAEHAARAGDAGLHTSAEKWLIENTSYERDADGEDR